MQTQEYVRRFFNDPNIHSDKWLEYFQNYVSIGDRIGDSQKFSLLDIWYHSLDVSKGFITQSELVEIMKWKLTRGKMRPLLKKIEALTENEVQNASYQAINHLKTTINEQSIRSALEALSEPLKGVGPATASAVLAKYNHSIPFMSDAGLLAVNGKLDYTLASYVTYYQGICQKVN